MSAAIERLWRKQPALPLVCWLLLGTWGVILAGQQRFWELGLPTEPPPPTALRESLPAGAARYLADHEFRGNLMVTFQMGAFISWKLHPAVRVSIDSRYEVAYPPEWKAEVAAFYEARGDWLSTLLRYPTDAVLVPASRRIARFLPGAPDYTGGKGWRAVYRDDAYSVYVRRSLAADYPDIDRRGERIIAAFP